MIYHEEEDSEVREFIEDKMREYDSTIYTQEDFDYFFEKPHKNIIYRGKSGEIEAFACLSIETNGYKMCYTYSSERGKRAYAKGIDYIIAKYTPLSFGKGAFKFNKIKRLFNDKTNT